MFEFVVDGEPMAKERARTTKKGFSYTPKKTVNYENLIRMQYLQEKGPYYENKFLKLTVFAYFTIPNSYTKKKLKLIEDEKLFPTKKDIDNIYKIVADGLQGVSYKNDSYIYEAHIYKEYTKNKPHIKIILDWMEEE